MNYAHTLANQKVDRAVGVEAPCVEAAYQRQWLIKTSLRIGLIVLAVSLGVSLVLGYPYPHREQAIYLFCTLTGFGILFQRYHENHILAVSSTVGDLAARKTLSWVFTWLFVTLVVALTELRTMPRSLLFATILACYVVDMTIALVQYAFHAKTRQQRLVEDHPNDTAQTEISYTKVGFGFCLLILSIIFAMYIKSSSIQLYTYYEQLFVIIIVSWLLSATITRAYGRSQYRNIYYQIAPILKLSITTALLAGMLYWYGQFEHVSRGVLFGSIGIFTVLQFLVGLLLTPNESTAKSEQVALSALRSTGNKGGGAALASRDREKGFILDRYVPEQVVIGAREELTEFLREALPAADPKDISVAFSAEKEYIQNIGKNRKIVINFQGLNFVEKINEFLSVNRGMMENGGYLVTWIYPLEQTYSRLRAKMPKSVFVYFYPLHFLVFRVAPKLPVLGEIYFYFTKGRYSNISQAEFFGRLAYNGFSVVRTQEIGHKLYVVACADRAVLDVEPSFGPIAKLQRIGYQGKRVTIYKVRTMHPYSEFIQGDICAQNGLTDSGKIRDDFRVTLWGRILRRYWLDELPQIYNWLRGDVGLVGVRALSEHYFSLYPAELQSLRVKYKPGLIPPVYADMPQDFGGILESERNYLLSRSRKPLSTDVKYFVKAVYQITLGCARSH